MSILPESLKSAVSSRTIPATATQHLQASMAQDIRELLPHLEQRGQLARGRCGEATFERGRVESDSLRKILEDQRRRVLAKYNATGRLT